MITRFQETEALFDRWSNMSALSGLFPSFFPVFLPEIEQINISVFHDVIHQGTIMEEMDFERRRELRRQKREEMRLEAERYDPFGCLLFKSATRTLGFSNVILLQSRKCC